MKIRRTKDIDIEITLTDEELIQAISEKTLDERITFFRKLAEKDLTRGIEFLNPLKRFGDNQERGTSWPSPRPTGKWL
jgi:hypothetical protein